MEFMKKQELKLPGKNMVELYGFSTMEKITARRGKQGQESIIVSCSVKIPEKF